MLPSELLLEKGWCRNAFCLDEKGNRTSILHGAYYSLPAAIFLCFWDDPEKRVSSYNIVETKIRELGFSNLTEYNAKVESIDNVITMLKELSL